jgi:hypothetical protein
VGLTAAHVPVLRTSRGCTAEYPRSDDRGYFLSALPGLTTAPNRRSTFESARIILRARRRCFLDCRRHHEADGDATPPMSECRRLTHLQKAAPQTGWTTIAALATPQSPILLALGPQPQPAH